MFLFSPKNWLTFSIKLWDEVSNVRKFFTWDRFGVEKDSLISPQCWTLYLLSDSLSFPGGNDVNIVA